MIINLQTGSSPKARVEYLLYGTKGDRDPNAVDILDGNADLFVELAEKNPYKTKTYNYLISFAESKEELQAKLKKKGKTIEELYEEILSLLLPAEYYPRESLNILAVGHADTDNYHIHLTIENYDYQNHKSLYIPKTRTEVEFYRALEAYINAKYGLSFGNVRERNAGRAGTEKIKRILQERGTYKNRTRDEVKEELTNLLTELVLSGEIGSREDLIAYLQSIDGIEIKRIGRSYISFEYAGQRYRLKGGIYDERRFEEVKARYRGKEPNNEEVAQLLEAVRREREKQIGQRRRKVHYLGGMVDPNSESNRQLPNVEIIERKLSDIEDNPVDSFFPLDWAPVIYSAIAPPSESNSEQLFPFLPDDRREWTEVERVQTARKELLSRYERKLDRVSKGSNSYTLMKLKEVEKVREEIEEIRKLELEYLKNLDPKEVLYALGITNWKENNGYLIMNSPLREDKNPSFEVFYGTERQCWVYMDFGTGWRGTSIDLWQAVRGVDYITAIREMREEFGINLFEEKKEDFKRLKHKIKRLIDFQQKRQAKKRERFAKREKDESRKAMHRIIEVRKPTHPALIRYLKERGIKRIPNWLKEIHYLYLPKNKNFFALAVQDENGVWHARNPYGKVNIITSPDQKPTYTLIRRGSGNKTVVVVEGLFDALTLLQIWKENYDIVILNSTTNTSRLIESGILQKYERVILALDADEAGQKTTRELYDYLKVFEDKKIGRIRYSTGKDLNECYMNKGKIRLQDITPKRILGMETKKEAEEPRAPQRDYGAPEL